MNSVLHMAVMLPYHIRFLCRVMGRWREAKVVKIHHNPSLPKPSQKVAECKYLMACRGHEVTENGLCLLEESGVKSFMLFVCFFWPFLQVGLCLNLVANSVVKQKEHSVMLAIFSPD